MAPIALELTQHEMNQLLGVHMLLSTVRLPAMRVQWERTIRYTPIAEAMSVERFLTIRQFFHVNDISITIKTKCRQTDDSLQGSAKFQTAIERQASFMACKSVYRAAVSGIVYDLEIYAEKGLAPAIPLGLSADVVLRLIDDLPQGMNFKVYFDNLYTSVDLIQALRTNHGIESCGTIRSNCIKCSILGSNASLKKKEC
ncbi:hypothetical protein QYM36_017902 [Artemia franciscana]|uniref:PiggyBac transposable element-derived protein domain-containing protein n=1 Tax=Artemia franciscana TaxID=6661 RepID=A0AA88L144_ARTSF|nr:hypothetical protein QYM36_017902 [Artemia franciscana]